MSEKRHYAGWDRQFRDDLKEEILAELSHPPYDSRPATYPQEKEALRRELLDDLRRLKTAGAPGVYRDPARDALKRDILQEAQELGLPPEELYARLTGGRRPSWRGRLKGLVTGREGRSFGWGVGLTLAAVLLAPGARRYVRPAARRVVEEVMEAATRVQRFLNQAREDLEDLVAEAKFHQLENSAGEKEAGDDAGPGTGGA